MRNHCSTGGKDAGDDPARVAEIAMVRRELLNEPTVASAIKAGAGR